MKPNTKINLADYQISSKTGFLPEKPQKKSSKINKAWHTLAAHLPKVLPTGKFKEIISQLPDYQPDSSISVESQMRTLSYLGHAFLWGNKQVPQQLPHILSMAWKMLGDATGRPPILSYPSYCLYNFSLINNRKPAYLDNIEIVQNFLGGIDEDWFILIHVDIEAHAAQAIRAIPDLLENATKNDIIGLEKGLKQVYQSLAAMNKTMNRMPENCDPYIYYTRVRPYIFGTKNNPDLPNGLIYENCYGNEPQFFRGETGAQSCIVPTIDGLLGVKHKDDPLKEYLMEMRTYMVPAHRQFIEIVEQTSTIRQVVLETNSEGFSQNKLTKNYNKCVDELFKFRAKHLEYAAMYIHKQALQANNSNIVGTGGTPFMEYLAKHRDETKVGAIEGY
jgi:indoleamine 2,3-dioxygenase